MKLLIFKTNITDEIRVRRVNSLFVYNTKVMDWNIDLEDIDKVLRIEADDQVQEADVIDIVSSCGLRCEALEG